MRGRTTRAATAFALLASAALAAAAAPGDHAAHQLPAAPPARFEAPAPGSYELPPIDRVSQHHLLGTRGTSEPLIALKEGDLALISFVYLNCGEACPLATAMLHRIDGELAKDASLTKHVELVTVSFDPKRDTPAVLADFGQDAVWIPGEANTPDSLRHVLKVFVIDANGAVRQIYSTGFLDVRLVLADLRTLLASKS
jgi:cytochrome oxidase Cu insertion factor (SCO1/SenC/PrrC family)